MQNLKTYLDAAHAADAEVKRIMAEIDSHFNAGTDDGMSRALALRPMLDEAQAKALEANKLYTSMRDASLVTDNAAALFTSPPDPAAGSGQAGQAGQAPAPLSLEAYNALEPRDRLAFAKAGGVIE